MPNPETHTCPDCGYVWKHGENGSHYCPTHLRALVSEFRAALHAEYSALTPPDSAPCQASVMRSGDRCKCSECRRSRYLELEAKAEALGITR